MSPPPCSESTVSRKKNVCAKCTTYNAVHCSDTCTISDSEETVVVVVVMVIRPFNKDTTFFGRLQTVASSVTSKNSEHSPQFGAQSHLCLISAAKQKIRPRNLKIGLSSDHISTKTQTKVAPGLPILRSKSDLGRHCANQLLFENISFKSKFSRIYFALCGRLKV